MLRFSEIASQSQSTSNLIHNENAPIKGIRALSGGATTPSVSFAQDTDTGIFNAGANMFGIAAGGTQMMVATPSNIVAAAHMTVCSNIVPVTNAVQMIGTSNLHFKEAWIDTIHISQNTLYLGDTPVLGTESDSIAIRADTDQSINVKTTGLGVTNLTSTKGVNVTVSGLNSVVDVQSSGVGGRVVMGATTEVALNAPTTTIGSNLTVQGNLTVNGTQFSANVQTVEVKDNILLLNKGQTGSGVSAGYAGIRIDRGDAANYDLLFNETSDKFEIGPVGSLVPIATQTDVGTVSNIAVFSSNIAVSACNIAVSASNTAATALPLIGGNMSGTITTTAADAVKHIYGNTGIFYRNDGTDFYILKTASNNPNGSWDTTRPFRINYVNGDVMIGANLGIGTAATPTEKLQVNGNIFATGNVIATSNIVGFSTTASDSNLKCAFEPLDDAINKITAINAYTFQYRDDESGNRHVGVIAQDVQKVLPEVVSKHPIDGTLTVAYGNLTTLLIAGLQEINNELNDTKARLSKLEEASSQM